MNTNYAMHGLSLAEQTEHNVTGWVGHHPGEFKDMSRGQTFQSTKEADINRVEVFTEVVMHPGKVTLTFHAFDPESGTWGPELSKVTTDLDRDNAGEWLAFDVPNLHVNKGASYGFKLESDDSYFGVGEAAGSARKPPLLSGQEWLFTAQGKPVNAFNYFSLSFKIKGAA